MSEKKKKEKKEKKQKPRLIDDGSTIADMSGVEAGKRQKQPTNGQNNQFKPLRATYKDKWKTYWGAVKMMFVPMLITIGILCLIYLIMWLIFNFA